MTKIFKLLIILIISISVQLKAQTVPVGQTIPNAINYTLPAHENSVSAGVYDMSGHLLRTLFSNQPQEAGTHTAVWDCYDQDGNLQTIGANYQLKVSYNNNAYTWEVGGNTSTYTTGTNVWGGGSQVCSMFLNGSTVYCATGFSEGKAAQRYFNSSTPQQSSIYSGQALQTGQGTYFNAGSNKFLFNAGSDYQGQKWFVFPERLSNKTEITFSGAVLYTPVIGRSYHAIDTGSSPITSFACQNTGNYLFVGHGSLNSIDVLRVSDSSGVKVQTISLSGVTALTVDKDNDNVLWVSLGTTVSKYTINSNGTITSAGATITGLNNVVGLDVKGGEIAVLDGGNQQIVKFYNSTTLSPTRTIGTAGGYSTSPTVSNSKFYLNDLRGSLYTFITHDGSGGIWVGDAGNARCQHYNSSGTFIETIMYIGTYVTYKPGTNSGINYCVNICGNQNTAIFSDLLEFAIDYSQPLATGWTLVNNWGYNLPTGWHSNGIFNGIYKYPNGRRFAIVGNKAGGTYFGELTSSGLNLILTTIPAFCKFDKYGNLTTFNATNTINSSRPIASAPAVLTYQKYIVTVPGSGNPTIGSATTMVTINSGYQDPLPTDRQFNISNGKITVFDVGLFGARDGSSNKMYHYAAYDSTSGARLWRTGISTVKSYQGDLPADGAYDIGNSVQYGGNTLASVGNGSYAGYHGEFWKQSETGIIYRWNNIGLLAGMFGVVGPQTFSGTFPFAYASNTLAVNATSNGGYDYIYLNDESQHSAFHRWKNDVSSEATTSITFQLTNRTYPLQNNITDYLANVPGGQVSIQGLSGTSQTPSTDVRNYSNSNAAGQFYTVTATQNFSPTLSNDVTLHATSLTGTRSLTFNLNPIPQWTFYGQLNLTVNSMISIEGSTALNYIQLLDNAGKVIARMYMYRTNRINFNNTWFGPFTNSHYGASDFVIQRVQGTNNVYFTINMWGQQMITTLPMYDITADITHPAAFQVVVQNLNQGFQFSINKLYGL